MHGSRGDERAYKMLDGMLNLFALVPSKLKAEDIRTFVNKRKIRFI